MIKKETYLKLKTTLKNKNELHFTQLTQQVKRALDNEYPKSEGKINKAHATHLALKFERSTLTPDEIICKYIADSIEINP
jgi:hypothetical protein